MSIYDNISSLYEKWSSGDAAYSDTGCFYVSVLSQMHRGNYLELGIGTGRISLEAIKIAPISMTGIDISTKMLEICQKKYRDISNCRGELRLCRCNATDLKFHEEFEGAVMPFRTIGHLMTDDEIQEMFHCVYNALKPGGWFILDHYMFNLNWAKAHNNIPILMYRDDNISIYDRYVYDFDREIIHSKVLVNDMTYECFDFRWLKPEKIKTPAIRAGFEVLSLMGEFDGSPWTKDSFEQIWIFRKPSTGASGIVLPKINSIGAV